MAETRSQLRDRLEATYRRYGWPATRRADGTLQAAGPGGVSWHGLAIVADDLADPTGLDKRLLALATTRMPEGGELCPLDLLPAAGCEDDLRAALDRTGLSARPHVSVYALTEAAA